MKRTMLKITLIGLFAVSLTAFNHPQQKDATAIVKRSDQKFRGKSRKSDVSMKIIRPSWSRTLRMKMWSLKNDYSLTLVTAPAKEQGKAFLKRENEIWNWVPDISRMIKLPPSMMSQSWMGSDFNNNDLIRASSIVTDYKHELVGSKRIRGKECYKIKMIPKPDAPVVWSKVITYISKANYNQLRTAYYGQNGDLVDLMKFSEVKEMGGRTIPTKLTMIPNRKEGHKTVMKYHAINFGIEIQPEFFSKQNMKGLSN